MECKSRHNPYEGPSSSACHSYISPGSLRGTHILRNTDMHIYIHMYREREREREGEPSLKGRRRPPLRGYKDRRSGPYCLMRLVPAFYHLCRRLQFIGLSSCDLKSSLVLSQLSALRAALPPPISGISSSLPGICFVSASSDTDPFPVCLFSSSALFPLPGFPSPNFPPDRRGRSTIARFNFPLAPPSQPVKANQETQDLKAKGLNLIRDNLIAYASY